MYDAASLRRQLEQAWADFIIEQNKSRRERANVYKTKKIMNQAHGVEAYFEIEFDVRYQAFSFYHGQPEHAAPFDWMQEKPELMGLWGAHAETVGTVEIPVEEELPAAEVMDEADFFAQHFTQSLGDAISGK